MPRPTGWNNGVTAATGPAFSLEAHGHALDKDTRSLATLAPKRARLYGWARKLWKRSRAAAALGDPRGRSQSPIVSNVVMSIEQASDGPPVEVVPAADKDHDTRRRSRQSDGIVIASRWLTVSSLACHASGWQRFRHATTTRCASCIYAPLLGDSDFGRRAHELPCTRVIRLPRGA